MEPPETKPIVVEVPDTTPPEVLAVTWYRDADLVEPVVDSVRPEDTVFIRVVFSEPVEHVVANDDTARPTLSIALGDIETQYHVKAHGENLESGDCKPLNGDTKEYLCKYIIPARADGPVTLKVGRATVDTVGNTVVEPPETEPLVVEVPPINEWELSGRLPQRQSFRQSGSPIR